MQGAVGDTMTIHGRRVDSGDRTGTIVEARHPDGPFLVRFGEDPPRWVFPGPDCVITDAAR